jgi:hypothetical protein
VPLAMNSAGGYEVPNEARTIPLCGTSKIGRADFRTPAQTSGGRH